MTTQYQAPAIVKVNSLEGALGPVGSSKPFSDAEIKHDVRSTDTYEAPAITATTDLDGALNGLGSAKTR